ncbi:MAG: hypothetical protein AAB837_00560 [Patescibacteria group bacterium]
MKRFLTLGILLVVLAGVFIAPLGVSAAEGDACTTPNGKPGIVAGNEFTGFDCVETNTALGKATAPTGNTINQNAVSSSGTFFDPLFKVIGYILMTISAFVLTISGWIFDKVIAFTILDMAKNINDQAGVGGAITTAWATLRDIANMCFIFVLLYAAFKNMFDYNISNFGKTVKDIIIIALLINFSLFFSKVVIDASNIVAIGFYKSIVNQSESSISNQSRGISTGYMNMLGLQTFYDAKMLKDFKGGPTQIMTVGIMSSVFLLITAVIFLMVGIMFAARFIILIFLMILSPLALIAYTIPAMKSKFDEWLKALIDQSFFAPLYFALTWVVFKLGNSLVKVMQAQNGTVTTTTQSWADMTTTPQGTLTLILNYVLIIGFSIAALIFSKQMATKGAVGGYFKSVAGGIGTGVIGGAALAGRNVIGRGSGLVSEKYRDSWSKNSFGRAGLWLADKGKKGSFDVRATETLSKVPGLGKELDIMGKAGGKGGFAKAVEEKAKSKAVYAKDVYGQTSAEKEEAEELKKKYEGYMDENGKWVKGAKGVYEDAKKPEEEKIKNRKKAETEKAKQAKDEAEKEVEEKEKKAKETKNLRLLGVGNPADEEKAAKELEEARLKLQNVKSAHNLAIKREEAKIEDSEYSKEIQALKTEADIRREEWDKVKNAGGERQRAYAKRLEEGRLKQTAVTGGLGMAAGGLIGGPVGALAGGVIGGVIGRVTGTLQGNKESARAVRKQAKEKSKAEKLADAAVERQKELDEEDKTKGTTEKEEKPQEKKEENKEEKTT